MLIKHGANVNAMDLWQFTPLHEAASKSRIEVCSLLLSEGADPTLLNCHSKSAIDVAPTRELQEKLSREYTFIGVVKKILTFWFTVPVICSQLNTKDIAFWMPAGLRILLALKSTFPWTWLILNTRIAEIPRWYVSAYRDRTALVSPNADKNERGFKE